jgi:hypothetical protein
MTGTKRLGACSLKRFASVSYAVADLEMANQPPQPAHIQEIIERIREASKRNFEMLSAQKPAMDQHLAELRARVELMRQGKSVIPANQPAIGRVAKVIKGRKVPVGT